MAKEPPDCGKCNGTGSITKWTRDRKGKRISYQTICDVCDGTGKAW